MIRYFAEHPTIANLLMLLLLAMGVFTISDIRREALPDVTPTEVEVSVVWPGATAGEVEEAVCQRIEDAIDGVRYVNEVRSEAREGICKVTIKMTPTGEFLTFKDDIDTEVNAIDDFPKEAEDPKIIQLGTDDVVLVILVSGLPTVQDLKAYSEDLKDRLQLLPTISLVDVEGFSDRQFRVKLVAEALMRYGLSVRDVADKIAAQSVDFPAGNIETRQREILVRFTEKRRSPKQLEDLVIQSSSDGVDIRLGDLGTVVDLFELDENKVERNHQRAARVVVKKGKKEDSIRIATAVRQFVEDEQARLPDSVQLMITEDGTTALRNQIALVGINGLQGMVLVFFTLWLFFAMRMSFWVVLGLPVSFLGACYFMPLLNLSINTMTLIGFLLALGLLMDDAIVISENIIAHMRQGKSSLQAAIDGTNEVKAGVISSFLTTICVLGPLAFIQGDIGKQLRVVPMILILVMAVSLIEALCILPRHLGHALHHYKPDQGNRFRRGFDRAIDWTREVLVGRTTDILLRFRYLFSSCMIALLIIAVGFFASGRLPFLALPDLEGDVIVARILLPQGTPLYRTEKVVAQVQQGLETMNQHFAAEQPNGQNLVQASNVQFNKNVDAFEEGPHLATITVDLLTAEERTGRIDDYLRIWRKKMGPVPDVISVTLSEPGQGSAGRAIDVRIIGNDLKQLKQAAGELYHWFDGHAGVINLSDDLRPGKLELRLRMRSGVLGQGLTAADMAAQISGAFQGVTADEVQIGPDAYEIDVRFRKNDRNSITDLDYFHFTLPDGRQVPLNAVAEIDSGRGWARIARVDSRRTVTLRGDIDVNITNTAKLFAELKQDFLPGFFERYPQIRIDFQGEIKEAGTTQNSMIIGMLIGLLGVFILLSFQFRNYSEPLIVMSAIPLTLIGVVGGHMLLDFPFTLPGLLGFVSLSGIVVNDSILLVEFIKIERRKGKSVMEAASLASRDRFRAVLLTSITTIAGLMPILAEESVQAQILKGLVISISFGLMASTVLVIFMVPCLYTILGDFGLVEKLTAEGELEGSEG